MHPFAKSQGLAGVFGAKGTAEMSPKSGGERLLVVGRALGEGDWRGGLRGHWEARKTKPHRDLGVVSRVDDAT